MTDRKLHFSSGWWTSAGKRSFLWRVVSSIYWRVISLPPPKLWLRRIADATAGLALDLRYHTNTGCFVPVERLGLGERAPDAVWYQPSSVRQLRKIVHRSGVNPADYTFVDLGCGKGRVLVRNMSMTLEHLVS